MTRRAWSLLGAVAIIICVTVASQVFFQQDQSEERRARAMVHAFMQARLTRDDAKVRTFLASDFHRQYVDQANASLIGKADPHYHKYRIESISPTVNGAWIAHVRIEEQQQGFAPAGWFTETIVLMPVGDTYRIGSVTPSAYEVAG